MSDPLVRRAIKCSRRFFLWSNDKDPDMEHFNEYVTILDDILKAFQGLIPQDDYTGEWI